MSILCVFPATPAGMMTKRITTLMAVCVALLTGAAQAKDDHLEARRLVENGTIMPLEKILEQVRLHRPGRILEVELEREEQKYIYEIDLLDDAGQVWELEVDAKNGDLLKSEQEE